ncbi:unnamed protein product, partial [Ilex paraguariensis]
EMPPLKPFGLLRITSARDGGPRPPKSLITPKRLALLWLGPFPTVPKVPRNQGELVIEANGIPDDNGAPDDNEELMVEGPTTRKRIWEEGSSSSRKRHRGSASGPCDTVEL